MQYGKNTLVWTGRYYECSQHGGKGQEDCNACIRALKWLARNNNAYLTGDVPKEKVTNK